MISPLRVLTIFSLIGAVTATAGESFRFDAPIGPDKRAATLHGYAFRERDETLRVVDLATQKTARMGDAFVALHALAGCNGGPAAVDGGPLGLVIASSTKSGTLTTGEPESQGLLFVQNGHLSLLRSQSIEPGRLEHAEQALQSGPLLVENGAATCDLDHERFTRRTVLVTSGNGDWAILYTPSTTLAELARMLTDGKTFPRFRITTALNLAGGTASGIWFERPEGAPPLYLREITTGRNALAILPK